jgi:O-antigen ligase
LHAAFFLLCLRFQIAAIRSVGPNFVPVLLLIAGGLIVGAWRQWESLFAFSVAIPLLGGLSQINFLDCAFPPSLIFAALWPGIMGMRLVRKCVAKRLAPALLPNHRPSSSADSVEDILDKGKHELSLNPGTIDPMLPPFQMQLPTLISDILITVVLLSLVWQFWSRRDSHELPLVLSDRAVLGFGDPWYFLTSAFLWLQGLFYFRILNASCAGQSTGKRPGETRSVVMLSWIRPVFVIYGVTMAVFLLFQYFFHIPEGWAGAGFQSPYEDISSFGSIAVAIFIFSVSTLRVSSWSRLSMGLGASASLLLMVAASWSRAAWLAGSVFLLISAAFRLSRRWTATFILITVAAVIGINENANSRYWNNQIYLGRLVRLVRLENPVKKDVTRIKLYGKAARMIQRHPFVGSGIGSFYIMSVNYAQPNDPGAATPDFAHNVFLQIAAEEGVPIAALFAGFIAWVLSCGICIWRRQKAASLTGSSHVMLTLGATLALGAYLQTQMTANSLNVYVSNQFFFWFLMAAILALSAHVTNREIEHPQLT